MDVLEYRETLHEEIARYANVNIQHPAVEFLNKITSILSEAEEFDDFVECEYIGFTTRRAKMQIDGYAIDDTDGSCCIFLSEYKGPYDGDSMKKEDIDAAINKIRRFVEESIGKELYLRLEESTEAYQFSKYLHDEYKNIVKFRFYIVTDAFNKQRVKRINVANIGEKRVEVNVWDIKRIFELVNSKRKKESVDIKLEELGFGGIPCVKAVEYHNVKADIDSFEYLGEEKVSDKITYSSYLAVIPGTILNELYQEYGSRLLEGNVRSFLSVRGKVNKSIQNTIRNYPEMFFAYNNGIAATATELETKMTSEGLEITRIKDLQIVNGGQTTASIANIILNPKKGDNIDVSNLYVPMKVSVLEHEMSEKIIPKISEYSNSQNKVDASDFFSNHPFHIRMEGYSRKLPAPAIDGNQYQQYWFYERTRGQYDQGKMKFKARSAQLNEYKAKYPDKQVIKLVDLARYMEIYNGAPDKVSKGKQAIVKKFSAAIKEQWIEDSTIFNEFYFKRLVCLAIIFKNTDEIIKQTEWYKQKRSYKANVIVYTMSIIFDYIHKNFADYEVDFLKIWNNQKIYPELEKQIRILCSEVYAFITDENRPKENVTEWCKQKACWELAQKQHWTFDKEFIGSLISKDKLEVKEDTAKQDRKEADKQEKLELINSVGRDYWDELGRWGMERKLLTEIEIALINKILSIDGKLSEKDVDLAIELRKRMVDEGLAVN
ncbi:AIPR protein [Granulicatella balaenopterae]|uniref:AIPR protein n=1 Tax=Granulicatella balaenopterae TaxID=137733 RepID=A0A1H9N5V6_9LACT|nr:AIPR family protein [Granulicatella balaenopterae]SER31304.1 AIPR protein [Granulicatella balaenopterae]